MFELPPGAAFLSVNALKISIPAAALYFISNRITNHLGAAPLSPSTFLATGILLALPGVAVGRRITHYHNQRKAAARGEVLPPAIKDPWPFNIGFLMKMIKTFKSGYPGETPLAVSKELGNIFSVQTGFGSPQYITMEPQHVKAVLATRFEDWEKGHIFHNQMKSVLGVGVFNSDGDMWKFHRAMTRPFFNKERISDFDIFDEHVMNAISQAKDRLAAGYPIDFQDMASRISLDSATTFLFNNDVRSLSAGLIYPPGTPEAANHGSHPSNEFALAFSECQKQVAFRTFLGEVWPLAEMTEESTKSSMRTVNNFIEPLITEALKKKKLSAGSAEKLGTNESEHSNLLDLLVSSTDDPHVIKDETLNIMIAGRDTIAATLSFTAYMLSDNPHVFKRLRQEVLDTVGPSKRPTYDDIKSMKYMRALINETLRLYPPVPFDVRTASRDTTFPPTARGGVPYFVPKGTECIYSVFLMHRREDLWGPDALVFDPDRFLDERVHKYLTPNPFIFLPFNAGPRICLGQQFAYNEISFALTRLVQTFDSFALAPDAQPPNTIPPSSWANAEGRQAIEKIVLKQHITMYCHGGLWMRLSEAAAHNAH